MRSLLTGLLGATLCGSDPGAQQCYGVCGDTTQCVDGRCEAIPASPDPPPDEVISARSRKHSKRRARSSRGDAAANQDDTAAQVPVAIADHVPKFRANQDQVISADEGSEMLSDATIHEGLRPVERKLDECLRLATIRGFDELHGTIDANFSIAATGRVTGVSATGAQPLVSAGIVACVREGIFDHRFPAFDGPTMTASYRFRVQ